MSENGQDLYEEGKCHLAKAIGEILKDIKKKQQLLHLKNWQRNHTHHLIMRFVWIGVGKC